MVQAHTPPAGLPRPRDYGPLKSDLQPDRHPSSIPLTVIPFSGPTGFGDKELEVAVMGSCPLFWRGIVWWRNSWSLWKSMLKVTTRTLLNDQAWADIMSIYLNNVDIFWKHVDKNGFEPYGG